MISISKKPTDLEYKKEIKCSEHGASMVEFAIVSWLLFTTIFFLVDTLNIYFRTHILADTVTRAARTYAINRVNGPTCAQYDVQGAIGTYIQSRYGYGTGDIDITVNETNTGGRRTLQVSAIWNNSCIVCQIMNVRPQAFAEAVIEDECTCL